MTSPHASAGRPRQATESRRDHARSRSRPSASGTRIFPDDEDEIRELLARAARVGRVA
jgi:hypothetical protein